MCAPASRAPERVTARVIENKHSCLLLNKSTISCVDFVRLVLTLFNMKQLTIFIACLLAACLTGCANAGQNVDDTPVGSVLSGDTKDADAYLNKVEQQNTAKTKAASQNQTDYQSHEHSNFGTMQDRY